MSSSENQLRPVRVLIPALVALLPLVHSMILYRWFMVPQQALLLSALGVLAAVAMTGSAAWLKAEALPVRVSLASFATAVVWFGIASWTGADPVRSLVTDDFQGTSWIFWIACLLLFGAAVRFRNELADPVSKATTVAVGILVFLTGISFVGGDLIQEMLVPLSPEGVPLPGIGNSAFLGAFYGAAGLLVLGQWFAAPNRNPALLLLAAAAFSLLVLTQSRVSIFATIVLLGAALWSNRLLGKRLMLLLATGFLTIGSLIQMLAVPNLDPPGPAMVETGGEGGVVTKFEGAAIKGGLSIRAGLWGAATNTIREKPFTGVGTNNFSYAYRRFASDADRNRVAVSFDNAVNDAHNLFLEAAATGGLPASLALLVAIIGVVVSRLAQARNASDPKLWLGLAACVLLAESLFQPINLVSIPLMVIFGALAMSDSRHTPLPDSTPSRALIALGLVPVLLAVTAAGLLLYSDGLLRRGSLEWTEPDLEAAVSTNPFCTRCLFELGKIRRWDYVKLGKGTEQEAVAPNRIAVERHPLDPEGYVQLGGGFLFMRQPERALPEFEKALELDPRSWFAGQGMAVSLIRLGRHSEAVPYLQDSVQRNPNRQGYELLAETAERAGMHDLAQSARQKAELVDPQEDRS